MLGVGPRSKPAKRELQPKFRVTLLDYPSALVCANGGNLVLVGLGNGQVVGLETHTGREVFKVQAHSGGVLGLSPSPDGLKFVTCGQDDSARLWAVDGSPLARLPGGRGTWVEHVAWAPAGGRIATASGKQIRVWSEMGEPLVESEPLASTVSAIAWRRDGTGLAASCYGGVHLLPFVPAAKARHFPWKGSLISLAWSPDAKVIACGSQDCTVHFWRLANGEDAQMSGYRFKPKALAWDSESKLLATAGDASVTVWDFRGKGPEGTRPLLLEGHQGICTQLAFCGHDTWLASGSQDTTILLWQPRKSHEPCYYAFLEDEVTGLLWHPAMSTLVGVDASGTACAWDVRR